MTAVDKRSAECRPRSNRGTAWQAGMSGSLAPVAGGCYVCANATHLNGPQTASGVSRPSHSSITGVRGLRAAPGCFQIAKSAASSHGRRDSRPHDSGCEKHAAVGLGGQADRRQVLHTRYVSHQETDRPTASVAGAARRQPLTTVAPPLFHAAGLASRRRPTTRSPSLRRRLGQMRGARVRAGSGSLALRSTRCAWQLRGSSLCSFRPLQSAQPLLGPRPCSRDHHV